MAEVQIKQQETQQKMQLEQAEFQAEQKRKDAETEQKIRLGQAEFEREQQRRDLIARARADAAREKARQSGEKNES
jgi:vacuolar-type H+-ATPase subunit H